MAKKTLFLGLGIAVIGIAALLFNLFRPPAEASGPIESIPIELANEEGAGESEAAAPTATPEPASTETAESNAPATATETASPTESPPPEESSEPIVYEIDQSSSEARYIVNEVLRGEPTTVIGRTNQVAGQIAVDLSDPASAQVGTILVNARTFATDQSRRDRAVQNWILNTAEHEHIRFEPTALNGLPETFEVGTSFPFEITGNLTIRDVTHEVTWDVVVTPVSESRLEGTARTTVLYGDWGLTIPDVPFVSDVSAGVTLELDFVALAQ